MPRKHVRDTKKEFTLNSFLFIFDYKAQVRTAKQISKLYHCMHFKLAAAREFAHKLLQFIFEQVNRKLALPHHLFN